MDFVGMVSFISCFARDDGRVLSTVAAASSNRRQLPVSWLSLAGLARLHLPQVAHLPRNRAVHGVEHELVPRDGVRRRTSGGGRAAIFRATEKARHAPFLRVSPPNVLKLGSRQVDVSVLSEAWVRLQGRQIRVVQIQHGLATGPFRQWQMRKKNASTIKENKLENYGYHNHLLPGREKVVSGCRYDGGDHIELGS